MDEPHDESGLPPELSQAGSVVAKTIEFLMEKDLPPIAIASALLGGALGVLSRTMGQEAVLRLLENALESVRAGELPEDDEAPPPA